MPRALLSVYNKTGLVDFARALAERGWDLVASGGTERVLREAGLGVVSVEQLTGLPEMLDGRVKTLHPAIHAGILARDLPEDFHALGQYGYALFSMVVCNLYPFQETVGRLSVSVEEAVEQIDVGGVALLRAAAKNFMRVVVVSDYKDYAKVLAALRTPAGIDRVFRRALAVKAYAHTRDYDTAIHAYLAQDAEPEPRPDALPHHLSVGTRQVLRLRYGENPHQQAAFYARAGDAQPLGGELLGGKQLSYNNILDLDAAWRAVSSFDDPTVVIVKHLTPTGIASANSLSAAYPNALASDPISAFGGVIAVNRPVDSALVAAFGSLFIEAIAAPNFSADALNALEADRKNCRLLKVPRPYDGNQLEIRAVGRDLLVQLPDAGDPPGTLFKTVTARHPTETELAALQYAWKAVQHVKSNAIVLAVPKATTGIGGGLPSRVDAVRLAITKAGERARGAVLASDAFFPFADSIDLAREAGVAAVIQPGGSIRDAEVIEAANKANIAMVFTGTRHFRH